MKKKLFAILLSFTIVAGMMPANTLAEGIESAHQSHCICGTDEYEHEHDSSISWEPLSEINGDIVSGCYYLTGDITITSGWIVDSTFELCLNGHSIICNADADAIKITKNGKLTITDCSAAETGTITHFDDKNGRGIYNSGELNIWRGSVSKNQYHFSIDYSRPTDFYYDYLVDYGIGIYNDGTFNMYGGSVKNNFKNSDDYRIQSQGGGVYNRNTFNMSGGSISENKAENGGGGVCNSYSANFNFSGGEISNNKSGGAGGGVLNESGCTFNMTGGVISGNRTERSGGGVSNKGTFNLSAGSITNNIAKDDTFEKLGEGGGISNFNGKIYMTGGTISSNECQYRGGGVYNYAETKYNTIFQMTGGSIIKNKVTSVKELSGGGGVAAYSSSDYDDEERVSKVNFTMTGGTISGNSAYNGGGIWGFPKENSEKGIAPEVNFILSGGTISENIAKNNGGGVYNLNGKIILSGAQLITDNQNSNLYIDNKNTISAKDLTDGAKIGVTVVSEEYPAQITYDVADEKYFVSDNPAYKISTNSDGYIMLGEDGKSYAEKPNAVFTADGPDSGKLTDVDSSMKYSIDGGITWHDITGESAELTGLSVLNNIQVVRKGTDDKNESKAQHITITKSDKPSALKAESMSSSSNYDGRIIGFDPDKKYEYRKEGTKSWKDVSGTSIDSLMAGNYQIRVKAEGTILASDYTSIIVEKKEDTEAEEHIYSDTTYTWNADNTECTATRKCTVCDNFDTETAKSETEVTQESTCTLPELTTYTVSFKNENGTDFKAQTKENIQTADAAGHKWDGGVQTKAPTYAEEGQMCYTCEVCGDTKIEPVDKLKLNEYDILEGKDGTYVISEDGSYSIRINCVVEHFVAVEVDGKTVDPKYYTVKSGSTIVTFTKEFLNSLGAGKHDVKFVFTNGTAKATITTADKKPEETKPEETKPEETKQEGTKTEETKPEGTKTESTKSEDSNINKSVNAGQNTKNQVTEGQNIQKQITAKQEKPKAAQKPAVKTKTKIQAATQQKKSSKTGDENAVLWTIIMFMLGGSGIAVYGIKKRKIR